LVRGERGKKEVGEGEGKKQVEGRRVLAVVSRYGVCFHLATSGEKRKKKKKDGETKRETPLPHFHAQKSVVRTSYSNHEWVGGGDLGDVAVGGGGGAYAHFANEWESETCPWLNV